MRLLHHLTQAYRSRLVKEVAITYSGQLVGSGLGFTVQLLLQKTLGPEDYGILALAVSVGSLVGVLTDSGISHAMVRFGSKYLVDDPPRAGSTFIAALLLRLSLTGIVSLAGLLTAHWLAVEVFEKPHLGGVMVWVYVGLVGGTLYNFWQFYIQTYQRFGLRSIVVVLVAIARFGTIVVVWQIELLSPTALIIVDTVVAVMGFCLGMALSPRGLLSIRQSEIRIALGEILSYARFTGILIVGDIIFNELDTFMLGVFATERTVGLYRAAWTYAMVLAFLNMSVSNVLFPKATSLTTPEDLQSFVKRVLTFTSVLAVGTLPAVPIVSWWIPWYDADFSSAVVIFNIMYVGLVFELVLGPIQYVLYSLDRPGLLVAMALTKIVLNVLGNLVLIPSYGSYGAAWATVITRVTGSLLLTWVVFRTLGKRGVGRGPGPDGISPS